MADRLTEPIHIFRAGSRGRVLFILLVVFTIAAMVYWRSEVRVRSPIANSPVAVPHGGGSSDPMRYILIGGGGLPESNEVQIEQDILLAEEVLGDGGVTLFAGGSGSNGVQVLGRKEYADQLRAELAQLFAPRRGRDSRYRTTRVVADASARKTDVVEYLQRELSSSDERPLLVLIAGHGDRGEQPKDNVAMLWGQGAISVSEYVKELDKTNSGSVTTVVTGCFSGGFAELIFAGADPSIGVTVQDRCGFFSTMWDLEASGCDPNPERRLQYGYGLYFLNALRGRDRHGDLAPRDRFDTDGDGFISFLEAHNYVRISSLGLDVPTSTSERWLRYIGAAEPGAVTVPMPEENAVVEGLRVRLDLPESDSEAVARNRFQTLQNTIEELADALEKQKTAVDTAYLNVLGEILAVWPVLDDPWHPDFEPTLRENRQTIRRWLNENKTYASYLRAVQEFDTLDQKSQRARVTSAPYERYLRALENIRLAGRLKARGGRDWDVYKRLVNCERRVP